MIFRKILIWIQRSVNTNPRKLFGFSLLGVIVFGAAGFVADIYLPFSGWGNVVRSIILLPLFSSMFVLGYGASVKLGEYQMIRDSNWVPLRMRMSPVWRRRISYVVFALLFLLIYATGQRVGYTFLSSLYLAIATGMFAYMRMTTQEVKRAELGLPDARDAKYQQHVREMEERRQEAAKERERKKAEKKNKKKSSQKDKSSSDDNSE